MPCLRNRRPRIGLFVPELAGGPNIFQVHRDSATRSLVSENRTHPGHERTLVNIGNVHQFCRLPPGTADHIAILICPAHGRLVKWQWCHLNGRFLPSTFHFPVHPWVHSDRSFPTGHALVDVPCTATNVQSTPFPGLPSACHSPFVERTWLGGATTGSALRSPAWNNQCRNNSVPCVRESTGNAQFAPAIILLLIGDQFDAHPTGDFLRARPWWKHPRITFHSPTAL